MVSVSQGFVINPGECIGGGFSHVSHPSGLEIVYAGKKIGNVDPRFKDHEGDEAFLGNRAALHAELGRYAGRSYQGAVYIAPQLSDRIVNITKGDLSGPDIACDGLMTDEVDVPLSLNTADCLQLALTGISKNGNRALALIHVGRQGTDLGIHTQAVEKFEEDYGVTPDKVDCFVGPSIRTNSYVFTPELAEELFSSPEWSSYKYVRSLEDGQQVVGIDLVSRAIKDLWKLGVPILGTRTSAINVAANPSFFSHVRREKGGQTEANGRNPFAAVLV